MKIDKLCFDLHAQMASKVFMGLVRVCRGRVLISEGSQLCLRSTGGKCECKKGKFHRLEWVKSTLWGLTFPMISSSSVTRRVQGSAPPLLALATTSPPSMVPPIPYLIVTTSPSACLSPV
jgi:hypothetical protein